MWEITETEKPHVRVIAGFFLSHTWFWYHFPNLGNSHEKSKGNPKTTHFFPKLEITKSSLWKRLKLSQTWETVHGLEKFCPKKGMLRTPKGEKEVLALKAVAEDLKEGISQVKKDNSKTGRAAFLAMKSLTLEEMFKKEEHRRHLQRCWP